MIRTLVAGLLVFLAGFTTPLSLRAADSPPAAHSLENPGTNNAPHVDPKPTPDAGRIAYVTAGVLEQLHYSRHPFDDELAGKFLDQYINALDPQHLHFLQSDLAEFASYRTNLDDLTLSARRYADTRPAYDIFSRFFQRMQQQSTYAEDILKNEKFEFASDDKIPINRRTAPFPKDLAEAKQLWKQRLRYEYLMQKLSLDEVRRTNSVTTTTNAEGKVEPLKPVDAQITETLTKNYHRLVRLYSDMDSSDVLSSYLNALAHTYDPHSDYQGPPDAEDFAMQMNLSFFGIGAALRSEDGYCTVSELMNGPALKSKKLKVGDRIVAVAQSNQPPVDVIEMPLSKAVRMIRGPKGTEVRLTIIPTGSPDPTKREIINLVRDEISLESGEAKGRIIDQPDGKGRALRLGVIDLPSFYGTIDARSRTQTKSTTADVAKLLKKFEDEKVEGVILDLRMNGGGLLEEAVRLTGLFIKSGPVVQIRDANGQVAVDEDTDSSVIYDGPLVVLTSRLSASASEITAAALQDYGRALVVGDVSTFGKGTAQRLIPLAAVPAMRTMTNNPGTVKITNSKFYRASGASTELKGVVPDIVLPSILNEATEIGENMLDNHMPWDTIQSASYEKLNLVQPYLPELTKRSTQRIGTNQDFAYLKEDIAEFRKLQADKTISLNEAEQIKERHDAEARKKSREKERAARKEPGEKVYEITLRNAGVPGLPPPMQKTNAVAALKSAGEAPDSDTNKLAHADGDASALGADGAPGDAAEESLDENAWRRKAALEETEHILADYLALLPKDRPVVVAH